LKQALKYRRHEWGSFDFPEIDSISEEQEPAKLQDEIENVLNSKKNAIKNPTTWSKSKDIIKKAFMALSPFAKNFLTVAANAQSVNHPFVRVN
jgi:hypothetical protein